MTTTIKASGSNRKKTMLIDAVDPEMIKVALIGNNQLQDLEYYTKLEDGKGSIHLGVIIRVLPGLQAVFVRYKKSGRDGFLPFSEIDPIYYKKVSKEDESINIDDLSSKVIGSESEIIHDGDLNELTPDFEDNLMNLDDNSSEDDDINNNISDEKLYSGEQISSEDGSIIYDNQHNPKGFICKNQVVLVQVIKEERGTKGATLSTFITLNGRYCIFMPNKPNRNGISRNVANLTDRRRLNLILNNFESSDKKGSVILCYPAIRKTSQEIKQDYDYLVKLWETIKKNAATINSAPQIIYHEINLIRNILYNISSLNIKNIIIEGEQTYQNAIDFARTYMPDYLSIIKYHNLDIPIFFHYGVDSLINNLFSNTVNLRSGGYLVIDKTEALVSIDINSGKSKDEVCIEETAFKTNMEGVPEVFTQIRLRNISGLIVIDLIGMKESKNNRLIENIAKRLSQYDKAKIQISLVEEFGLLIISRQRLGQSILEIQGEKCKHCHGSGFIKIPKFILMNLFNEIKIEVTKNGIANFNIVTSNQLLVLLMNEYREQISKTEYVLGCKIIFLPDYNLSDFEYKINRIEFPKSNLNDYQLSEFTDGVINGEEEIIINSNDNISDKIANNFVENKSLSGPNINYIHEVDLKFNNEAGHERKTINYEELGYSTPIVKITENIFNIQQTQTIIAIKKPSIKNQEIEQVLVYKIWNEWLDEFFPISKNL